MKYKLIGENDFSNPIATILKNRGIDDINSFLNIDESNVHSPYLFDNIELAVKILIKHLDRESKIFIQVDSDCDGYVSACLMYQYIKSIKPNIEIVWGIHESKIHGVMPNKIPLDVNLVIIPDAGSNDYKEHKILYDRGADVIVLDHHECDKYSEHAVIVNNQMCNYPNKNLSGVGIVYKFCQVLDDKLGVKLADNYLDLVAIGLIGDMVDSREPETRYYMNKGIKQIKNLFLDTLIKEQDFSLKGKITIIGMAFYVVPLINSVVRIGSNEEKTLMFESFIEGDKLVPYKKNSKTEEILEPLAVNMTRKCKNIKTRQSKATESGLFAITSKIKEKALDNNKVLIVEVTDILEQGFTGLVANNLINIYKRPVILIRHDEDDKTGNIYKGSGRGYEKSEIKDFKKFLSETNKFIYVEGHSNAFGIKVSADGIIEANNLINQQLKDATFEDVFDVDFIISASAINFNFMQSIDSYNYLWGQNLSEPLIAINNLTINKDDIKLMGENSNTIKFKSHNVDFIKFRTDETVYHDLIQNTYVTLDLVGRVSMNEWHGRKFPQIIIDDYNIIGYNKYSF